LALRSLFRIGQRASPECGGREIAARRSEAAVAGALRAYPRRQSLPNVRLALDAEAPVTDQRGGKLRQVIVAPQQPSPDRGSIH